MKTAAVVVISVIIANVLYREYDAYRKKADFEKAVQQMNAEAAAEEKQQELKNAKGAEAWAKQQKDMQDPAWWKKDE